MDTTLSEPSQTECVSMSAEEKLRLRLNKFHLIIPVVVSVSLALASPFVDEGDLDGLLVVVGILSFLVTGPVALLGLGVDYLLCRFRPVVAWVFAVIHWVVFLPLVGSLVFP